MKQTLLIFCFAVGLVSHNFSQDFNLGSVNLNGGKQFSSFLFTDSQDQKDQNISFQMYNSFGINACFTSDKHTIRPEIQLRQAGAKTTIQNTPITWKMNYFNFNIGYGYSLFKNDRFNIQTGAALAIGYMLNGEQSIGQQRFSIIEEESMTRFEIGTHGFANLATYISDKLSLSLEYRFGVGLNHIENDIGDQKTRNIYHSALLGIGIRI
jgi:hypothetical protein